MRFFIMHCLIMCGASLKAQHTFSICAVDPLTGEVGSAGASCIDNSHIISDVHPGVGVVHTQSYYIAGNQNYAEDLMDAGVSPEDIIDSLVAHDIFDDPSFRQYGVVDLTDGGRSAAYTGENCLDWKGHLTSSTYSIQGNILLGPEILDGMEAGFLDTEGNLGCKLMAALQGAKVPGADTRCLDLGISALSAFLRVAQPDDDGALWLDLKVRDVSEDSIDPIDSLQILYDAIGGCNYTGVIAQELIAPTIFPQPANDMLAFSLHGVYDALFIYDISGALIYTAQISGQKLFTITTANWMPGMYLYTLQKDNNLQHGKLLLQ